MILTNEAQVKEREKLKDFFCALLFFSFTALLFGALFARDSTLSHSIGYSLYGAERVLEGEIPYRDFHTLYPPAIVYLNAAVFKLAGISLYNALLVVFVFKTLTALALYFCARRLMPRLWAIAAASFSLLWLRPNGPFKAVPMHYGALFLVLALYLLLVYLGNRKPAVLIAAGFCLGLLALFKHNIGAYSLIGSLAVVSFDESGSGFSRITGNYRRALTLAAGLLLTVAPVCIYFIIQGALGAMMRALLLGPGEFLLSRLAATPSPAVAALFFGALALSLLAAHRLSARPRIASTIAALTLLASAAFLLIAEQERIDSLIFYAPVVTLALGVAACFASREASERQRLFLMLVAAASAFLEAFPRFAREQAIAAMPFVALLLLCLIYVFKPSAQKLLRPVNATLLMVLLPLALLLMGGRLMAATYFDEGFRLRSDTALAIERGRGVYFPSSKAEEIDQVTDYIRERIPEGGYFFAQSYTGSSYLFLADRNNPSGAQFWGGVGVSDREREETLAALDRNRVELILTSRKDIEAEKYEPMRRYIQEHFEESRRFGEVIILERKPE